jgi:predicted ATP-grasp superfamily ATP-dependent carboligase
VFRLLAAAADWTLVVAPEADGALPSLLDRIEQARGRSLGSTPAAARLAGDKLRLAERLRERGVPTPPSVLWPAAAPQYPAVCKPRHGAGSQATFLVRDENELSRAVAAALAERQDELVVQPYVAGLAASAAFLIGPGRRLGMPSALQDLSTDGRFRYRGGSLPLPPELAERASRLAARAVDAVEGLRGYVGVDVVLGAEDDAVIEINPRLTTSYVGLRALARFNLAETLLAVARGEAPPEWDWQPGPIRFTPDGAAV